MSHPVDDDRLETLEGLLNDSKSVDGRARLNDEGTLTAVLRLLSSSPPTLILPRLQLVRNLCADDPANQDAFIASGGLDRVASVLCGPPPTVEIVRTVLQVLANIAAAGEAHRDAVWARFFPVWFREIARVRNSLVCGCLCLVLDVCCSGVGGRRRLGELCEVGRGLPILINIVMAMSRVIQKDEYLYWLLGKACIEGIHFTHVFQGLSYVSTMVSSTGTDLTYKFFTAEQVFFLETLSNYLTACPGYLDTISKKFALGVLQLMEEAYAVSNVNIQSNSGVTNGATVTDVLEYSLFILRDLCSWKHRHSPASETEDPADSLLSAGLIELLLRFLRELKHPNNIKNREIQSCTDLKVCPYQGFRKDVVSVICNCLRGRKQVQDEIRKQDGIPLLLQQCVVDEYCPYMKELGTISIRYLLDGNLENQFEVAELELRDPVITPQIAEMGLRVEMDEKTHRSKMVTV
ncbi:hypothetical protein Cni_G14441 [Canna indica]|uniref:Ataxin-10 domain-containing protein n=1 Tax=Canna indica TaxID=4628 RepID=A0AAQ3KC73_9LILI|nr:hypothetical protein Cni_G14441 [Canna indica]